MNLRAPSPPAVLMAAYLILRLLQALSGDTSFDNEEGFNLAAAWELIQGAPWPLPAFQLSDWENGSLLVVMLEAPLAALLGPVMLVQKLTGLLLSLVTLAGLYLLGREAHGKQTALLACALFALFPGPLFHYSLTAHGFHPDSTGLQLIFLWLLLRATRQDATWRAALLAGVAGGLSIYFAYISAVTVAGACLVHLAHCLFRHRRLAGRLGALAAGLVLGTVPLLASIMSSHGGGVTVYGGRGMLDFISLGGLLAPREETISAYLHFSNNSALGLHAGYTGFNIAFWAAAAAALTLPLVRRQRTPGAAPGLEIILPAVTLLTLVVTIGSGHPVHPWHLAPLITLLLLPLSAGAMTLWRKGPAWGRIFMPTLLLAVALAGIPVNVQELRLDRLGVSARVDGRNYPLFLRRLGELAEAGRLGHDPRQVLAAWSALPLELALAEEWTPPYPQFNAGDMMLEAAGIGPGRGAPTASGLSPQARRRLANRVGYGLTRALPPGPGVREELLRRLTLFPDLPRNHVAQGIGFGLPLVRGADLLIGLWETPRWRELARGMAVGLGRAQVPRVLLDQPAGYCGEPLPLPLRAAFGRGIGMGTSCRLGGEIPAWIQRGLCPALWDSFSRGGSESPGRCIGYRAASAFPR